VSFGSTGTTAWEVVVTDRTIVLGTTTVGGATGSALNDAELADIFGLPEEAGWQERALCSQTDPEAFFPEKGGSTREAKRICTGCEVRNECLEYALEHDERFGIWGGLSERERRRLKRRAV
jgi:WhiB family redox-sensing transcriptional regulator